MTAGSALDELRALAALLAERQQADILIYSGDVTRTNDGCLSLGQHDRTKHPNCLLVFRTLGGSFDSAYRLARSLRRHYARVLVYLDDYCKGAGVLLALAADELVISDFGELGPLDHGSPLNPSQVAEVDRAMKTAELYVDRLGAHHLKDGGLERLLTGYPGHDFVIDREEASEFLHTVRAPTTEEGTFLTHLEPVLTAKRLQGRLLFLADALSLVYPPKRALNQQRRTRSLAR